MSGPEHYREAERLLEVAKEELIAYAAERNRALARVNLDQATSTHQRAQVHATLALAAATVATREVGPQEEWGGHAIEVEAEWQQVTA